MLRICALIALISAAGCGDDGAATDAAITADASGTDAPSSPDATASSDAAPVSCTNPGGTVNGTIAGEGVEPVVTAWYGQLGPGAYVIVLDELDSTCGVEPRGTGEHLVLGFCDVLQVGEYSIVNEQAFPTTACPGQQVAFSIVEDQTSDLDESVSGTITIESIEDCVTGSYSVTYDGGDTLTGTFIAAICPS